MRTTVDIESDLLKRLRQEAHHRGVPFKHLLNRVLRQGLADRASRRAGRFEYPTFQMGQPNVNLDKALRVAGSLEDEEIEAELDRRK